MTIAADLPSIPQCQWAEIYENSAYTIESLSKLAKVDGGSIRKYLWTSRTPRKSNMIKMEIAMYKAQKKPRLLRHPSYGYATEEQIKRLHEIGMCPERDMIMKEIEKQTANRGKYIS